MILKGKIKAARRSIRVSSRVAALLAMIQPDSSEGWVFPAATKAGHINQSSLKKQHVAALKASGVKPFVIYDARHTCLIRWAKTMDPFTLKKLAGHESLETTMKYIHLNESDSEKKLLEARRQHEEQAVLVRGVADDSGHTSGHTF